MFEITEETKKAATDAMDKVMVDRGYEGLDTECLDEMFDVAVAIVKKQFGI